MEQETKNKNSLGVPDKLLKPYNPQETESRIYKLWEESDFFAPENLPLCPPHRWVAEEATKRFSIVMPPPNVTGVLHMGHALMLTLEDITVRYKRMRGFKTLWLPGTDHAAIATQSVVEKELYKKEGETRHEIGREEFLRRVNAFVEQNRATITSQMRVMGASCDWSREAFTFDESRSKAVKTMFKKLYDDGLIYRGHRIVNWDPKGQTTISDDEIVYEERKTKLYTFRYSKDFPIPIATTRPETKLGDVAVAVHPDDARYKKYIGQSFAVPNFAGVSLIIRIVGDSAIDPAFGTGAVGVTPAHSQTDWEIAERHRLNKELVIINEYARMTERAGPHAGKKVAEAREAVVAWLATQGLLAKEAEITHNLATAERTGGVVEPLPKLQWFVNVSKPIPARGGKTLKELMREPVEKGGIQIIPDYFAKTYFHWIDTLRDWCISRQIWYGHRIPVWYKRKLGGPHQAKHFNQENLLRRLNMSEQEFRRNTSEWQELPDYAQVLGSPNIQIGATLLLELKDRELLNDQWIAANEILQSTYLKEEIYVGVEPPTGTGWEQDSDTLDTWFSSGLWTFSTLGWPHYAQSATRGKPEPENDLANFHPTDVLETGTDILFFWVARMILMSQYALGEVPFRIVYLNGMVRDARGRKFSKSLGNGIDPIDVAKKFGADAGRMALVVGNTPGTDTNISEEKIRGYKHFTNKLWNITRFILENTSASPSPLSRGGIEGGDIKLLEELDTLLADVTGDMESYRFYLAAEKLYHYAWHTLADKILEESKTILKSGMPEERKSRQQFLLHTLDKVLRALHPFIPFVTEELWQLWKQPKEKSGMLMVQEWSVR